MSRRVSVITPVHPEGTDYLNDAYESLVTQQLPTGWAWEWLIQLDGHRIDELASLLPVDERISYGAGRKTGNGAAVCRTLALSRANGELIKVLDADDRLTAGALARDIAILRKHPDVGWTTSGVLDLLPDGSTVSFDLDPPTGPIRRGDVLHHWLAHDYRAQVHPATLCVYRELLLILGGWMALPASEDTGLLLSLKRDQHWLLHWANRTPVSQVAKAEHRATAARRANRTCGTNAINRSACTRLTELAADVGRRVGCLRSVLTTHHTR